MVDFQTDFRSVEFFWRDGAGRVVIHNDELAKESMENELKSKPVACADGDLGGNIDNPTSYMNLFGHDPTANLLPRDGTVNYHGPVLDAGETLRYYEMLLHDIPWKNDEAVIFGKRIITARKVAWYGDSDFAYSYSGNTKHALAWTPELSALRALAEKLSGAVFNSCLLNLYHDGGEGMAWHSDDEKSLRKDSTIASVSLGAEREFRFKHKHMDERASVLLESGSLLVMKDATQTHWLHCIPKSVKIRTPRVNLTFRTMVIK